MRAVILSISLMLGLPALAAGPAEPGSDAAKNYRLETEGTTRSLQAGEQGKLVLAIVPLAGTHVHPAAPLKIALSSSAGVKLAREQLGHPDAVDPKAEGPRFEVPFAAVKAGPQEARAKVDFYLCSDQWCVKQARDVAVAIEVK